MEHADTAFLLFATLVEPLMAIAWILSIAVTLLGILVIGVWLTWFAEYGVAWRHAGIRITAYACYIGVALSEVNMWEQDSKEQHAIWAASESAFSGLTAK